MNAGNATSAMPPLQPPMQPPLLKTSSPSYPGEDAICEQEFRESFSKSLLNMRFKEFDGGKITKRYLETYLEFMHLSGMISNLDYLDYKNKLIGE